MSIESQPLNQSQKILNAAFTCISAKGYANVSLRDIANEADVVLSQLTYYYKNKEGLFVEVVKMLSNHYLTEIESQLKKGVCGHENLSLLIQYFQDMLKKNQQLFKLLFDLTSMAIWSAPLKELLHNFFQDISDLIEKYVLKRIDNHNTYENHSTKALSDIILGTLFGTSIQVILSPEKDMNLQTLTAIHALLD